MRRPSLPRLEIPVPCPADWRAMEPIAGDSRARLCRRCDKPVYDSRSMTRDELHALIAKTEGSPPCLRLHRRPDGTIVTKGCRSAVYRTARFVWIKAAALAVAFWSGVIGLRRACDVALAPTPASLELTSEPRAVMGKLGAARKPKVRRGPAPRASSRPGIEQPLRHLQSEEELLPPDWRDD